MSLFTFRVRVLSVILRRKGIAKEGQRKLSQSSTTKDNSSMLLMTSSPSNVYSIQKRYQQLVT